MFIHSQSLGMDQIRWNKCIHGGQNPIKAVSQLLFTFLKYYSASVTFVYSLNFCVSCFLKRQQSCWVDHHETWRRRTFWTLKMHLNRYCCCFVSPDARVKASSFQSFILFVHKPDVNYNKTFVIPFKWLFIFIKNNDSWTSDPKWACLSGNSLH